MTKHSFSIAQNRKKVNSLSLSLSLSLSSRIKKSIKNKSASLWRLFVSKINKNSVGFERSEPQSSQVTAYSTTPRLLVKAHPAFTIVELLIVIVIIAILAAITIISYTGISNRAKNSALSSTLQSGAKKVATYALQNSNTVPVDKAAFLTIAGYSDGNTTYQYTANTATTPALFCITATQDSISYHIAGNADGAVNKAIQGPCTGHTGTAPTKLADGSTWPTGYIVVPGNSTYNQDSFCAMKYEAKNDGSGNAVSTAAGTPWVNINWDNAKTKAAAIGSGYHLMTEAEWMTIAANLLSVSSNWQSGTVGSGATYRGHSDNSPANALAASTSDSDGYNGTGNTTGEQRRTMTLTNGEVIWDIAGNVWEWTDQTITGNQPGASGFTWREWTNSAVQATKTGLSQLSRPDSISAAAAGWSSGNNVGQLYSASDDTSARAFRRGGSWNDYGAAGVTTLILNGAPSGAHASIGWRAAR